MKERGNYYTKIDTFPEMKNENVLKIIKSIGFLNLKIENSHFNNLPEMGPFQYIDKSVYLGQFKDGNRHGRGKFLFSDGSFYEGFWRNDVPFGFCRLIKTNGTLYEGMCQNLKVFIFIYF